MLIPIGNTLRGCRFREPMQRLGAASTPFLGVACSGPNSTACDRVGIGVYLRRRATLVVAQIAGRLVTLSPPTADDLWLGYLFDAGLRHGPLKVHVPAGTSVWLGSPEVLARVRAVAFFPDGRAAARSATVLLHPGFG